MLSNFPFWPLIDDSVPNPTVEDNDIESPKGEDERRFIPPQPFPPTMERQLQNSPVLLEGINTKDHEDVRQAEQNSEPRCHVATNKEVLSEALSKEDVPGADNLAQHVLSETPPLILVVSHLWILTLLPQARQSPQIKHHRRNQSILAMVCDVIAFPDTVVGHVAYEIVNAITWSTRASQLDPGESY